MNRRQALYVASGLFLIAILLQTIVDFGITRKNRDFGGLVVNRTVPTTEDDADSEDPGDSAIDVSPTSLLPPIDTRNTSYCHIGRETKGGNLVLVKVRKGLRGSERRWRTFNETRILCLIYTYDAAHARVRAIAQTWGRQCDGFLAASNLTDPSIGAFNLEHDGPETYDNMWQKIRSFWNYTYQHYRTRFDYFYILGDDMYVAMDNLRAYLGGSQIQRLLGGYLDVFSTRNKRAKNAAQLRPRPLLLGLSVPFNLEFSFPLGGCGYVLNRAALDLFAEKGLNTWYPDLVDSREDVLMGAFFWEHGVTTSDFRDENGAFLCQAMTATQMFAFDGRRSQARPEILLEQYGVKMLKGMNGVSPSTIAFHLKSNRRMKVNALDKIYHYHVMLEDNSSC